MAKRWTRLLERSEWRRAVRSAAMSVHGMILGPDTDEPVSVYVLDILNGLYWLDNEVQVIVIFLPSVVAAVERLNSALYYAVTTYEQGPSYCTIYMKCLTMPIFILVWIKIIPGTVLKCLSGWRFFSSLLFKRAF